MKLKPMSLNQKEQQQQQDTIGQSNKSEAYVVPGDDDTSPMLKIEKCGRLVLYSYKDVFLKAGRTIKIDSDYISLESDSNYSISEMFQC